MNEDPELINLGQQMLEFYISLTFRKGYFQGSGNKGFWDKKNHTSPFDEQAIEAYSMTSALISAYLILKDKKYLGLADKSYLWFWGQNRLKKSLVDKDNGAVYDGLEKAHVNDNQGAESYLALCLAYFALTEKIHL